MKLFTLLTLLSLLLQVASERKLQGNSTVGVLKKDKAPTAPTAGKTAKKSKAPKAAKTKAPKATKGPKKTKVAKKVKAPKTVAPTAAPTTLSQQVTVTVALTSIPDAVCNDAAQLSKLSSDLKAAYEATSTDPVGSYSLVVTTSCAGGGTGTSSRRLQNQAGSAEYDFRFANTGAITESAVAQTVDTSDNAVYATVGVTPGAVTVVYVTAPSMSPSSNPSLSNSPVVVSV